MFFLDTLRDTQKLVDLQERIIWDKREYLTAEQFEGFLNRITDIRNEIAAIPDDTREAHLRHDCHCIRANDMLLKFGRDVTKAFQDSGLYIDITEGGN